MSFEDDIRRIYEREKEQYGIEMMKKQNTIDLEYEFETFKEWKENRGCNYK